jgi:ABC-type sulfate transport system permease component
MELAITTAIESLGRQKPSFVVPRPSMVALSSTRARSVGGLGAFIMIAKNFDSFGNALIKKLIAEIVLERGVPMARAAV